MSLEDTQQLIDGAHVLAAGRTLGLTDDQAIATKQQTMLAQQRKAQRNQYRRGGINEGNTLFFEDDVIRELDAKEREFQRDKPQREADLLGMSEYGSNEADLQQVSAGRVSGLKAQDASGIGSDDRGAKVFNRARRDLLPQNINASIQLPSGKRIFVSGQNAPVIPGERSPQRVSDELRDATMLQEMGLAFPEREQVPYQTMKDGTRRRNFGRVQKDADGNIIKERMSRVKRARGSGQPLDPADVISVDKYPTARRSSERGIGNDGPTEISNPVTATKAPLRDAYLKLATAVESGQVSLDDTVEYAGGTTRTVRDVLIRLEGDIGEAGASDLIRAEASNTVLADEKSKRARARRQLREFAIQAKADGNPLSKKEAEALLTRLQNPKEVSDLKAERDALGLISSQGSTREVLGETHMSDEAWKSKSSKQIAAVPILSQADQMSDSQVIQKQLGGGGWINVAVGNETMERLGLEDPNAPTTLQNVNVPENQRSLINFISENLQYDSGGGLKPSIITTATQDFTDAAASLSEKAFGEGVSNIPTGIHNLAEAQGFMDRLIERRQEAGGGFSRYNEEDPTNPLRVPDNERPTVSDLMSTMNVDKSTQGRLANALYQMALAEGSLVNAEGKERYGARQGSYQTVYRPEGQSASVNLDLQAAGTPAVDLPRQNITFDSPAGFFYDGVDAQYIPNSKRQSMDGQNVNIQAALRNITNPDGSRPDPASTEPFIGAVAREPQGKLRYRKGFGADVSIEDGYEGLERSMVKGKRKYSQKRVDANVSLARELENRHNRSMGDKRAVELGELAKSAAADDALASERQADNDMYDRRRSELLDSIASGRPLPGHATELTVGRIRNTAQPIRNSSMPMSIAPEPGAGTGGQVEPMIDAGGAGQKPPTSTAVSSNPMPDDLRRQLFALDGPSQGPEPRTGERTRQQRIDAIRNKGTQAYSAAKDFATKPEYKRGRRITGASLAGLAGVVGLANISRGEEEQQY